MEEYLDFFDYVFKRGGHKPRTSFVYDYSFEKWREISGEKINPQDYSVRNLDNLRTDLKTTGLQP